MDLLEFIDELLLGILCAERLMLAILRVCLHCQKINPTNVGRVVYCISRPYTFGRRSRDHQLGAYLRPLLFATTVTIYGLIAVVHYTLRQYNNLPYIESQSKEEIRLHRHGYIHCFR